MNDQVHGRTLGCLLPPVNRQCRRAATGGTPCPGTHQPRPPPPDQASDPPDFKLDRADNALGQVITPPLNQCVALFFATRLNQAA